jgi:hypothetical protein
MLATFYIYLDNVSHLSGIILVILSKAYVIFDPIVDVMLIIPFFFSFELLFGKLM